MGDALIAAFSLHKNTLNGGKNRQKKEISDKKYGKGDKRVENNQSEGPF